MKKIELVLGQAWILSVIAITALGRVSKEFEGGVEWQVGNSSVAIEPVDGSNEAVVVGAQEGCAVVSCAADVDLGAGIERHVCAWEVTVVALPCAALLGREGALPVDLANSYGLMPPGLHYNVDDTGSQPATDQDETPPSDTGDAVELCLLSDHGL